MFLIGTSDYKDANIKQCYSPFISPSLAGDLHRKVEQELGINISEHQSDIRAPGEIDADTGNNGDTEYIAGNEDDTLRHDSNEADGEADANASGILDGNEAAEDGDHGADQDGDDSGFGLEGRIAKWTAGKFWNYVDATLSAMRTQAHESAEDNEAAQESLCRQVLFFVQCSVFSLSFRALVQFFQQDLSEFPGKRQPSRHLTTAGPTWQTTIQSQLIW